MHSPALTITTIPGTDAQSVLPHLAQLRLNVFREFPYLYDGSLVDELAQLQSYTTQPKASISLALDGEQIIGVATCLPLASASQTVQQPFLAAGLEVDDFFYFGESVLQPAYRGRGIGVAFFQARETQAKGYKTTCFCAVERPATHPQRPKTYVPLDQFWRRRGYQPDYDLSCSFSWRDVGDVSTSKKTMIFWLKDL